MVGVNTPLFGGVFEGRRVLVTGHTGFKGSWLSLWLLRLGAEVTGYALAPDTEPSLYDALDLGSRMDSRIADVRDSECLAATVQRVRPEYIFHLAAQPLVRRSYREPVYTFEVNVMGTVNLLEAVRRWGETCLVVNVTTDKVYANSELGVRFRETDPLGGHDVYSASKACSEIVTASYRDSFLSLARPSVMVATARAGNVVGGGDWAQDRIIPDAVRALSDAEPIVVRNPESVRPWQHVLEPVAGYLMLAEYLSSPEAGSIGAVNFGPNPDERHTVGDVVERAIKAWGSGSWVAPDIAGQPREAGTLELDTQKAHEVLGWSPVWGFGETIARTIEWYRRYSEGSSRAEELCVGDIAAYCDASLHL